MAKQILMAVGTFLFQSFRPFTKAEMAYGWWDFLNLILTAAYATESATNIFSSRFGWSEWGDLAWLAGIPAALFLIAGIKANFRVRKLERKELELLVDSNDERCVIPRENGIKLRVGLRTTGARSISEVKVELAELDGHKYTDVDLFRSEGQIYDVPHFTVKPSGGDVYCCVDLCSWDRDTNFIGLHLFKNYFISFNMPDLSDNLKSTKFNERIPMANHVFVLRASGNDTHPVMVRVELEVDDSGNLLKYQIHQNPNKLLIYREQIKSLYPRLSHWTKRLTGFFKRYGSLRLLKRHSNSSR